VAPDWKATPNQVALVSGVLNGVLSAIGCVIGGWVADRVGRWWAYFGSGILIAMVAIIMAVAPRTPNCVHRRRSCLRPDLWNGLCRLFRDRPARHWPRRRFHQIRNALFPGQLPIVYMTASDGWVHDRFGTAWMLHSEALIAIICIVLGLVVLRWINPPRRSDLVLP
jgi:hypothetical protein